MDNRISYDILAMNRTMQCSVNFQSELTANTGLAGMFGTLGGYRDTAEASALKLNITTKEFTIAGVDIREKCAFELSIGASVASGYGAAHNITALKNLNSFTKTELLKGPLEEQILSSKKIIEEITPHATVLQTVGLSAAMLGGFSADITLMENLTKIPQNMIDAHKIEKGLLLDHLGLVQKFYDEQLDRVMQLYKIVNMTFFLSYTAARKVRHHHTKRKIKPADPTTGTLETYLVYKSNLEPVPDATYTVTSLNITMMTDVDGETFKDGLAPGTYHGKFSKTGYKDVVFDFTIVAGKTCALQFVMEVDDSEPDVPPVS